MWSTCLGSRDCETRTAFGLFAAWLLFAIPFVCEDLGQIGNVIARKLRHPHWVERWQEYEANWPSDMKHAKEFSATLEQAWVSC